MPSFSKILSNPAILTALKAGDIALGGAVERRNKRNEHALYLDRLERQADIEKDADERRQRSALALADKKFEQDQTLENMRTMRDYDRLGVQLESERNSLEAQLKQAQLDDYKSPEAATLRDKKRQADIQALADAEAERLQRIKENDKLRTKQEKQAANLALWRKDFESARQRRLLGDSETVSDLQSRLLSWGLEGTETATSFRENFYEPIVVSPHAAQTKAAAEYSGGRPEEPYLLGNAFRDYQKQQAAFSRPLGGGGPWADLGTQPPAQQDFFSVTPNPVRAPAPSASTGRPNETRNTAGLTPEEIRDLEKLAAQTGLPFNEVRRLSDQQLTRRGGL